MEDEIAGFPWLERHGNRSFCTICIEFGPPRGINNRFRRGGSSANSARRYHFHETSQAHIDAVAAQDAALEAGGVPAFIPVHHQANDDVEELLNQGNVPAFVPIHQVNNDVEELLNQGANDADIDAEEDLIEGTPPPEEEEETPPVGQEEEEEETLNVDQEEEGIPARVTNLYKSSTEQALLNESEEVDPYKSLCELVCHCMENVKQDERYADLEEIILEPQKQIVLRVLWKDDQGEIKLNRGFFVKYGIGSTEEAINVLKGGLLLHPSISLNTTKFLALLETLKHSLWSEATCEGSMLCTDFQLEGKTESELTRFCKGLEDSLKDEKLQTEEPETNLLSTLTLKSTKDLEIARGLIQIAERMLDNPILIRFRRCAIVGFNPLSLCLVEELINSGAVPVVLSDHKGYVYNKDGIGSETLKVLRDQNGNLESCGLTYQMGKPWKVDAQYVFLCDIGLLCREDAAAMSSSCHYVIEGPHMVCSRKALEVLWGQHINVGPSLIGVQLGTGESGYAFDDLMNEIYGQDANTYAGKVLKESIIKGFTKMAASFEVTSKRIL